VDGGTVFVRVFALGIGLVQEDVFDRHSEYTRDLERDLERRRVLVAFDGIYGLTAHPAEIGQLLLGHLPVVEAVSADQIAKGHSSRSAEDKQIRRYVEDVRHSDANI
jgi:hypothetical protein